MTISAVVPDIAFAGSSGAGTMGPFSLTKNGTPIIAYSSSEFIVLRYETATDTTPSLLVEGTHYTLAGGPNAWQLTLISPSTGLLTGEKLYVFTETTISQLLDLINGGNFSSSNLERRLDIMTLIMQQLNREIKSTIRFAMFDTDEIPKTTPLGAVIDKVPYVTGTASSPTVAYLDATTLADLDQFTDAALADIAIVAADLASADTIGIVAASIDDVEDVAANMADVNTVADAVNSGLLAARGVRYIEEWTTANGTDIDTKANIDTAVAYCRDNGLWLDWGGRRGKRVKINEALAYSAAGEYLWISPDIDAEDVAVGGSVSPKVRIGGPALGSAILLSSDAAARATQIVAASALTVGGLYILQSNGTANGDGVTKRAELIKIRSLDTGTTYNLEEPLSSAYTTADGAQVQLYDTSVVFQCDGVFRLSGDPASTSVNDYGLALVRLYGAELPICHGSDIASCHVLADLCVNSGICSDWGWGQRAKNTGQGYFLEIAGGYNLRHGDLWGEDLRHVRTFTHSSTSTGHGALGNLLGRGLIGGHIMGDDMRSSADDSHAGYIDTITGDCITNIAAGVTVPEAFVIEHAKAKVGRIIVNGGDTNGLVIQSYGHPDTDQNYVEIESVSVNMTGAVDDWAGIVANRAGENGHGAQTLFFKLGLGTFNSTKRGLKMSATSGAIRFDIGMLAINHETQQAILLESSASYGLNGVVNYINAQDGASSTGDLIYANATAGDEIVVTLTSGRLAKSGGSGALLRTTGAADIVTGPGLALSPGAGGTVNVGSGGSVLLPGQVKTASLASGSAVSLTTGTPANVTSVSLEPGVWRVTGQIAFTPAATTSITTLIAALNATSATLPTPDTVAGSRNQQWGAAYVPNANNQVLNTGEAIITLTATTTVYLVGQGTFTVSTLTAFGKIQATRVA